MEERAASTARPLRATYASRAEAGGPSEHTIETACTLVSETANGISAVKVGYVVLDAELERLARSVAGRDGVRLVLRVRPTTAEADLVIEQAIAPIHHQAHKPGECDGLLSHLIPRRRSTPEAISRTDRIAAEMEKLS